MSASSHSVLQESNSLANAAQLGICAALLLAIFTGAAFAIGIATPPRSGSFCTGPCADYPYSDAAQFVPHDFIWMIPAILLTPLFVVLTGCIHACTDKSKRHLAVIALCFASVSAAIILLDYFIEMEVVQPSLLHAETVGVALFSQYNPHGIFIALEGLGYLVLNLAFGFLGFTFSPARGMARALRLTFLGAALLSFLIFAGMCWVYGLEVGFRFEIAVITVDWTALIVSGILLAIYLRRFTRRSKAEPAVTPV